MHRTHILIVLSVIVGLAAVVVMVSVVSAGDPDNPPGPPSTTYSYTLEDIYERLETGADGAQSTFTEPSEAPPTGTMHTLNEIMMIAPVVDDTNGATQGNVFASRTAWGLIGGGWGVMTGTMPDNGAVTIVPTTTAQTIAEGYHDGSGYVAGDTDLAAGNIRSGASIFGVAGDPNVVNTASGNAAAADILSGQVAWVDGSEVTGNRAPAPVQKTGQVISYTVGDDGDLEMGVDWISSTRFITGTTGVVTDTLTGLVWLQDAGCLGISTWANALAQIDSLNSGTDFNCHNYTAGTFSDWRLPNVRELHSLVDFGRYNPALPSGHPFTDTRVLAYWSSTTYAFDNLDAWLVDVYYGIANRTAKTYTDSVWSVRGGQ